MLRSFIDDPRLVQFGIAFLFFVAVAGWGAIRFDQSVQDQRERQDRWLDERRGDWK